MPADTHIGTMCLPLPQLSRHFLKNDLPFKTLDLIFCIFLVHQKCQEFLSITYLQCVFGGVIPLVDDAWCDAWKKYCLLLNIQKEKKGLDETVPGSNYSP